MENKESVLNGLWVVAIIIYFGVCLVTNNLEQFVVIVSIVGVAWIFIGNVFKAANNGIKKVTKTLPKIKVQSNTQPVKQEVEVTVSTAAPVAVAGETETPATVVVSGDTRKNTVSAVKALPKQIAFTGQKDNTIPVIYDGKQYHNIVLGKDGHWGVFGTTGSGKGNILQLIALSVLQLGPKRANLYILDGKGGLDYAFALDIDHAYLYYANTLDTGCSIVLAEMERRNKVLMDARKRNIHEYNKAYPDNPIPLQVVIADELVNFSDHGKQCLETFAAMCRAMGGVLFISTQYPTTEVIPSQIQANVTNRIVGRLVSSEHSRVALRRIKADVAVYEPAMIPVDSPGIMVLRRDAGNEVLGRSPELTEAFVSDWINKLVSEYPKVNPVPNMPAQSVTEVSQSITAPLTEEEMIRINDWLDDEVSRREMARRLYKLRGGNSTTYTGDGPVYQLIQKYLDSGV